MARPNLSAYGLYTHAPKLFEATITHANITAAGASQAYNLGTLSGAGDIPAGAVILGVYYSLGAVFALAGDATFVAESLTIDDIEVHPVADWDIRDATASAGAIASHAVMRKADGPVSLTLTADVDMNPTTAGSITVGIIYFVPEVL